MKIAKKSTILSLVLFILIGVIPISSQAAENYVSVNKTVSPSSMTTEEEALVTLNITGTPPVNVIRPNDVILIIDRSGSMADENKMQAARESAKDFIDLMDLSKHRVGIVDFSSDDMISSFPLSTDKTAVKNYIDKLRSGGGTATGDSIKVARQLLSNHRPEAQPVIVLMTDGDATEPKGTPYQYALSNAAEAKEEGIVFYTIALLLSNDDPNTSKPNLLLKDMATTSHHHHFVLGSVGLAEIYAAIVQEIGLASAYDVVVKDVVSPEFEIVPGSYDSNIPKPIVTGNTLTWNFLELKTDVLSFTYKIRHKKDNPTGILPVSTLESVILYKDYTGAQRKLPIPNENLTVTYPKPTITKVELDNGNVKGGETVIITGTNFRPNPSVRFGIVSASNVQYISSTEIRVQSPAGEQGIVDLIVTNDDRQQAKAKYLYYADPVVNLISPNSGPMAGENIITISGKHFLDGVKVKFGEQYASKVAFNSSTLISVLVPKSAVEGPVDVMVENPDSRNVIVSGGYNYIAPLKPTIESLTPSEGQLQGSELITLKGTNFEAGAKLFFNNIQISMNLISDKEMRFRAPAWASPEKVDVKVVNISGEEYVLKEGYTYLSPPKPPEPLITSLSPDTGQLKGNELVILTGSNFQYGAKLYFDNIEVSALYVSDTQLRFRTPAWSTIGKVDVKVVNPDHQEGLLIDGYEYLTPPAPTVLSVTPKSGLVSGGTRVIINGTDFVSGAKVYFNNIEVNTTFIANSELIITTPSWGLTEAIDLKVVNPDLQETIVHDGFTYTEPPKAPEPIITSITPNKGLTSGGELATIYGSNFVAGAQVYMDSTLVSSSFLAENALRLRTPAWTTAESVDIKVVNPDGGAVQLLDAYVFEKPVIKPPTITSLSPDTALTTGGSLVYINGKDFQTGVKLYLSNIEVPVTILDANMLRFRAPAWSVPETVDIKVVNPDLQEDVLEQAFTYTEPPKPAAPTITSVSPNKGPNTGNNYVYIIGSNYQVGVKVWFGNTEAKGVTLLDSNQIRVITPAASVLGTVDIKVTNPDLQTATLPDAYTYQDTPITISSISPAKGLTTGGQLVYIYGTNFKAGLTIHFNGQLINYELLDSGTIRFRTPVTTVAGTVPIVLTSISGSTASTSYTYEAPPALPAPTINSISPNHGPLTGGTLVYVYGTNFRTGITATWGGSPLAIEYLDAGTIRFRVPAGTVPGTVELKLINSDNSNVATSYTYDAPPVIVPAITTLSPTSGPISGGNLIYIYGRDFQVGVKVTVGSTTVDASYLDSATLRFRAPAVPYATSVTVTVTNPDGKISNSMTYEYK